MSDICELQPGQVYRSREIDGFGCMQITIVERLKTFGAIDIGALLPYPIPVLGKVWVAESYDLDPLGHTYKPNRLLCTAEGLADREFTLINSSSPQADVAPCGEDAPSATSRDTAIAEGAPTSG